MLKNIDFKTKFTSVMRSYSGSVFEKSENNQSAEHFKTNNFLQEFVCYT